MVEDQSEQKKNSSSILSPPRPTRKKYRKYIKSQFGDLLDSGQLLGFQAASRICQLVPEVCRDGIRTTLRDACFYLIGRIRQVCYGNLTIARGEVWDADHIKKYTRSIYNFWSRVVVDFLRLRHVINDRNWTNFIQVEGLEHLNRAQESPRGVIVAGPHMANWEFIGQSLAWMGYPITSIARRRNHSSALNDELMDWRTRWGQNVVYTEESPRKLLRLLKNGKILGIVADQYSGRDGIFTDFFGAPTAHYPGVAVFANRMQVPVVPVKAYRTRDGIYHVEFDEPIQPVTDKEGEEANRALIQTLFQRFEEYIRTYPRQWMWFHRKWRDKWLREEQIELLKKAPYLTNYKK